MQEKAATAKTASWSYSGDTGPEHWGEIAPLCASGTQQSPINLDDFAQSALAPIKFDYGVRATEITNTGHDVRIGFAPGGHIEVNGHSFALDNLHFHSPAEHEVEGESFAIEGHFVNIDEQGNIAVVGLLYDSGAANARLAKIADVLPMQAGEHRALDGTFSAEDFLPDNRDYYSYEGSLTTPPCTEGVRWLVLRTPLSASQAQANAFMQAVGGPNNRPLQALNARSIFASQATHR